MKKIFAMVLMAVLSLGILTACGGGGGGATTELTVTMGEGGSMEFNPKTVEVNKGDSVKLTLINKDPGQAHSFVSTPLNFKSKQLAPNTQEVYTFKADKAGNHEFFCDVPGHKDAQMVGKINVK